MAGKIKPTLTLDDFNGNQEKLDKGQQILDTTWNRANPEGTLAQNFVQPKITFADTGGVGEWGEYARAINNAYDRANGTNIKDTPKGINEAVATGIANGTIKGNDIPNNYAALAAGKMDQLQGMGSFNYDFNKDPMFKILSQSYMQQARQAANNASAMAAARTGGYGNSYGAAAASQQYNAALGNLYDQVPELQDAAYQRYLNDRNDLYKQAGYYNDLEAAARDEAWKNKNFDYTADQDQKTWDWRQKEFDYNADQDQKNWDWKTDERDYERNWNEDERNYQRDQNALDRAESAAQYLASLGYYDAAEQLYGADLSVASQADDFNKAMTLITKLGLTGEEALTLLQKYLGISGLDALFGGGGSGSGGGGGGKKSGGSGGYSYTPAVPVTQQPVTKQANGTKPVTQVVDITEDEIMRALRGY